MTPTAQLEIKSTVTPSEPLKNVPEAREASISANAEAIQTENLTLFESLRNEKLGKKRVKTYSTKIEQPSLFDLK